MFIPQRIAVFVPNWVGDAVMATPALRGLRRHFVDAHITYIGRQAPLAVLAGGGLGDDVAAIPADRIGGLVSLRYIARRLRAGRYDLAVLLPNSFRTAAASRLGGVGRVAGYQRDGRGWLLTDKLAPLRDESGKFVPVSAIDYYCDLVAMLGAECDSRRMELVATADDIAAADALLDNAGVDGGPLVMLNPGGAFGPSKIWDSHRYAGVADRLMQRHGAQIIINAAPSERAIAASVDREMCNTPAVNFAELDNSLGLLKGLLRRCSLLITNDTGARHIAAALGTGVVTLFGSTDPRWSRIDYDRERIIRVDVPCSPCQKKMCAQPPGPLYHQCMSAITPEMVLQAAEKLLAAAAVGEGRA